MKGRGFGAQGRILAFPAAILTSLTSLSRDRWSVQTSIFNLLDSRSNDIEYLYASRLPGEPSGGVSDIHTHPSEPREVRASIVAKL